MSLILKENSPHLPCMGRSTKCRRINLLGIEMEEYVVYGWNLDSPIGRVILHFGDLVGVIHNEFDERVNGSETLALANCYRKFLREYEGWRDDIEKAEKEMEEKQNRNRRFWL